jgi:hypothetical protein
MIDSTPRFLQGAFAFTGAGYATPKPLDPALVYHVPPDKRAQLIYLRAGNSSAEMAFCALTQNGRTMRVFPVGAKAAIHVPLAVVEDLQPDTKIEVFFGAPEGESGTLVVDIGLIEI